MESAVFCQAEEFVILLSINPLATKRLSMVVSNVNGARVRISWFVLVANLETRLACSVLSNFFLIGEDENKALTLCPAILVSVYILYIRSARKRKRFLRLPGEIEITIGNV